MTTQIWIVTLCTMLALYMVSLIGITLYHKKQWANLDRILDNIQNENHIEAAIQELSETRESKIASRLHRILNTAYFKESQAIVEKNQITVLLSDISHQLKTPLANIVMNMELLQDDTLPKEKRLEFLAHTKSQAEKMQWLMDSLLKASRLENGMIQFHAQYTGIKQTIAQAVSAVYAQASARQIQLSVEDFQDITLYHNPKWTAEALTNILENAIKYSPEKSCIRIAISRLDIYTRITIQDEGIGIPEKEYNHIFQRFYRGKEVNQQEGSGLGLYLAQLILQCEKGYISVSSKIGQGSCFSVFLLNPTSTEINYQSAFRF
ncbi:MAG: HAMP domain-containing histidine kinase [Blautia sp.]|nr:HAMP domain-containing histidine kinase [Lachnoclostridium sp.]MCM1211373.1 HAMP domain-containing histidine kinase [Blautia sp.]